MFYSFLSFWLRTRGRRFLGRRVLVLCLSPFALKACLLRVLEASMLFPTRDHTNSLPC